MRPRIRAAGRCLLPHLCPSKRSPGTGDAPTVQKGSFTQPVNHFPNDHKYAPHTDATYQQRYWYSLDKYKPGGPIYLMDLGEVGGDGMVGYLSNSIFTVGAVYLPLPPRNRRRLL